MMDKIAQKKIIDGMLASKSNITVTAGGDPNETVREAFSYSPKCIYYLEGYTFTRVGSYQYDIQVRCKGMDIDLRDIYTVNSVEECVHHICQYAGDYKKKLVVVAKESVKLREARNEFYEKHMSFYSNLMNISSSGYTYLGYIVYEFEFKYRIGKVKLSMMELEVDKEVERIAKLLFLPGMPIEVKVYLAHNYLTCNVAYKSNKENNLATSYTQSAYGAFIKHECVCQGYSEAFKRLMDYAGIPCIVVCGKIVGSDGYHAWNIVTLGENALENSYHIDVTWDVSNGRPKYSYFCKNDTFLEGKRTWNKEYIQTCKGRYSVLSMARTYVYKNKNMLLLRGIDPKVIDC